MEQLNKYTFRDSEGNIRIEPEYFDNFEDAVKAFKELEKTVEYAVLCKDGNGYGYGVFDETEVINYGLKGA